jgi:uncharacterized protein YegP (UPF0339 family)
MGKYVIKQAKNDKYFFSLKASNGQIIFSSQGYASKSACMGGIESVQKNCSDDSRFERKEASNGKPFFVLKAGNHQVIGQSEMYESVAGMENGIESVKKNGTSEVVEEE